MSKLANRIRPKTRCECYPCRNKANIALGPIERKGLLYQVCEEHARQIRDDLVELLADETDETQEAVGVASETQAQEESLIPAGGEADTASLSEGTESADQTPDIEPEMPSKDSTEPQNAQPAEGDTSAEPAKPVYTCKHCGEPFEKKTDLMSHSKVCPNKPPKES